MRNTARSGVIVFLVFFAFASNAIAGAEIPSNNSPDDVKVIQGLASKYSLFAKTFHCDEFVFGTMPPQAKRTMASLEYVPQGDDVNRWTRMVTVSVYPLVQDQDAQISAMKTLQEHLLSRYGSNGKILNQELLSTSKGYPRVFIEYEIGDGVQKEHNVGVFSRTGQAEASFVQAQFRSVPYDQEVGANMKLFAEGKFQFQSPQK